MDPWSLYKLIPKLLFLTEIADTNIPAIILIIYLHLKYLPVLFHNHPYMNSESSLTFQLSILFISARDPSCSNFVPFPMSVDEASRLVRNRTPHRGMRRGKARCARSIIIHPTHYPSTGTIDEPTPTGSPGSPRQYPPTSHSTRWKFSGIIRDLRRGECAATRHPRALTSVYTRARWTALSAGPSTMT